MNIILLSGGSGTRLWPLSNDIRSKQFIKFLKKEDGSYESMVQRVFRQIKSVDSNANIVVATSSNQLAIIHNQLGDGVKTSVEPSRKDTFPAIALACSFLIEKSQINDNESVIVCPIDTFASDDYFLSFLKMKNVIDDGDANLVLLGLKPTEPSDKFGYIVPKTEEEITDVISFEEKPQIERAKELINKKALWNGGVFGFKISHLINRAKDLLKFKDYNDLLNKYNDLEKISFDYAFSEKEQNIKVIKYDGLWKDIGTWSSLIDVVDENCVGSGLISDSCESVKIINELSIPVLAVGVSNIIISSSPEGILVTNKEESSSIKPYVDSFDQRVMFAERSWGSYQIINIEDESLTLKVVLNPGHSMNYHSHLKRDEVWVVISGKGKIIVDGIAQKVCAGDVVKIKALSKHTIIAETHLQLIEVQLGKEISIFDKIKHSIE